MNRSLGISCTALALTLTLSLTAWAEEGAPAQPPGFDAIVAQAMAHYQARRYEQALALFEQAFAIEQEPELVYNIARSHERLLHRDQAVEAYERFLEMPGTTGELRARALTNLTALRQEIAALGAARSAPAVATPTPAPAPEPTPTPAPEPRAEPEPRPDERPAARPGRSALGAAGWALFGIGAGAAGAGAVCWGLAMSANGTFQDSGLRAERVGLRDDVMRRGLAGDVLVFTGAATLVIGIVLVAVDARRRRALTAAPRGRADADSTGVALAPLMGPGGLGFSGTF